MIRIITYNCYGMKSSIVVLYELCRHNDLIFLQEIWLFKFELNLISTIHPEFEAYGISAIQDSEEIINGRPYGGLAILFRKQYRPICDFQTFDDSRLLAVTISWKDVHKITNSKVPLATKVDGCVGDAKIAEMWKCHYKSLLNSVQSGNSKNSVMWDVNKQIKNSVTITPFDILDALKNIKCGKSRSSGIDGISAEHFVFVHSRIHVLLSLLFSTFITHGYLPGMFMKTAIVPIIKNKTGDTNDKIIQAYWSSYSSIKNF